MTYSIAVENIKCGGCANSIRHRLLNHALVEAVTIDVEQGAVRIQGDPAGRAQAVQALTALGYPEVGSVEGFKSAAAKAKSFVSCAIGRVDRAGNPGG